MATYKLEQTTMAKMSKKMEDEVTTEVSETVEVVVTPVAPVEEERKPSAQTLAEMEAGRASLKAHAASARAEKAE